MDLPGRRAGSDRTAYRDPGAAQAGRPLGGRPGPAKALVSGANLRVSWALHPAEVPVASLILSLLLGCSRGEGPSRPPPEEDSAPLETPDTGGGDSARDTQETSESIEMPWLCVNEILADDVFTLDDPDAGRADLIELFNGGDETLDLAGYLISDDPSEPGLHVLDQGLTLGPRGHLLLFADGEPGHGPQHLGFKLDAEGETVTLSAPDGAPIDVVRFSAQATDWSAARVPDGATTWDPAATPTPGESNGPGVGEPDRPGGAEEVVEAPPDLSEAFYSDGEVLQVGVEISESGLVALEADPGTYVRASLSVFGRVWSPVAVRCKGENSFLPITQKCSLKVKLDEYVDGGAFLGLHELTLNNMSNDPSMMHERVAYRMYREAGVPAARSNHAWVTLNGAPYGLFANVETVNRDLLARWYADPEGSLWEVHDVDFTDDYIASFTAEYGVDDRTDLQGAADALEGSGAAAFLALTHHMSVESFINYWAVSAVVGQFDSYPYSSPGDDCHVFDAPASGVLEWLPHGVDETFSFPSNDVTGVNGAVARRCLEFTPCRQIFEERVWEVQAMAEDLDLLGYARDVRAQIGDYALDDPNRPYDAEAVDSYQELMLSFIAGRAEALPEWVGERP